MTEPDQGWAALRAKLQAYAEALADAGGVRVVVDGAAVEPLTVRPARFFGLVGPKRVTTQPVLELLRQEQHLRAECTGDARHGGAIPFSDNAYEAMGGLGWHRGGGPEGNRWVRYWPDDVAVSAYPPQGGPAAAAGLVVATLTGVFEVADPAAVTLVAIGRGADGGAPSDPA